jgi:glycosyltransferase involved in cell wall biosynthesis
LEAVGGGICVPAGDEDAFAGACGRLLGEPDLHARLAEAGRAGVAEFDVPRMAERYAEVFEAGIAG